MPVDRIDCTGTVVLQADCTSKPHACSMTVLRLLDTPASLLRVTLDHMVDLHPSLLQLAWRLPWLSRTRCQQHCCVLVSAVSIAIQHYAPARCCHLGSSTPPLPQHNVCSSWHQSINLQGMQAAEVNKELLELLCAYLPRHYPDRFSLQGSLFTNHALGQSWDVSDPSLDPLEVSTLNVQACEVTGR